MAGAQHELLVPVRVQDQHVLEAEAREEAIQKAVSAGADPATIQIMDVEEVPLAYLPSSATRIRVKAVGDLVL